MSTSPLIVPSSSQGGPADAQGRAQYRLRTFSGELMSHSLEPTASLGSSVADVWRIQFSIRYLFN